MLEGKTPVDLCSILDINIWREPKGSEGVEHILPEGHGRERTAV
jgi:hypothetical protein